MADPLVQDLGSRSFGVVFGFVVGSAITAVIARYRRLRDRRLVLKGDARDSVVIEHHVLVNDPATGVPRSLHVRSLGQAPLPSVIPNAFLANALLKRSSRVTALDPLISMDGAEGSFLLETLANYVGDRAANGPFEHDLYVMAPCREQLGIAQFQPVSVIVIRQDDLERLADWEVCRNLLVEHGSDGGRVLTLHVLARHVLAERDIIATIKSEGKSTRFAETTFVLDLALDRRVVAVAERAIPWGRFAEPLKLLGLSRPGP